MIILLIGLFVAQPEHPLVSIQIDAISVPDELRDRENNPR
jgi:hypothetical protein